MTLQAIEKITKPSAAASLRLVVFVLAARDRVRARKPTVEIDILAAL
jgi:hypothetical protein